MEPVANIVGSELIAKRCDLFAVDIILRFQG